ncbi:MAG: hypothetical protein CL473_09355 [Acidobacteria bacterium]|nr:hypothetical protein [Acidobacteriota bacterium]
MTKPTNRCAAAASLALLLISSSAAAQPADGGNAAYYVSADATETGDGTRARPFRTLAEAELASIAGDTIYLLAGDRALDGAVVLKPGQRLLGLGPDGTVATDPDLRVAITNTTPPPGGVIVTLAAHSEVAGLHFLDLGNHAISGARTDYTGSHVHHITVSGNAAAHVEDERGLVYAISLAAESGIRGEVRIEDSHFMDGEDLGAIRVFHSGNSRGRYLFQRNAFADLGGRAYFVRTQHTSRADTIILDSEARNIGRGNRNSDSIIPYLMGQSEQVMLVRNYQFSNPDQEGNQSNTGIEAYMFGAPRPDQPNWCTGCRLTLKILDSVLEHAVTDPIQFSNSGRDSVLAYEIRNTQIIGGTPRQGGGGISLNLQPGPDSGGRTTLLVENTDVIGTDGYGFALNDRGGGPHDLIVDLGGGVLGSRGHNRFVDNSKGPLRVAGHRVTARHNWWGGGVPVAHGPDDRVAPEAEVLTEPVLTEDPR